jgi:hypothetical protein|nr:putative Ig domain-containing protein [Neorhizobium tomejilense]
MSRKPISFLLSIAIAANIALPASGNAAAETYYFRHKFPLANEMPEQQTKDIVAYFVGGVGIALDEKLPMKPEWEDDSWTIRKGALPIGITFDTSTKSFKGTPTSVATDVEVELEGFDKSGASVATAKASFDVYAIQGEPYQVDLYAHTGKYKLDQLPLPERTIETWNRVYAPPAGINIIGRNLDGTPTKAGVFPVFLQGEDYLGNVVATYFGKYTVEDGPTFPFIEDAVSKLPQMEFGYGLGPYDFGAPSPFGVRAVNPAKKVRYYAEIKQGDDLPYGIALNDSPDDIRFKGTITRPYDTATVRFKAVDSDGTVGFSNWFTFGSSDPQPGCYPNPVGVLTTYTGIPSAIGIPRPYGAQGDVSYELVSGTLPEGLVLERTSGLISGVPKKAEPARDVTAEISVVNDGGTVKTSCAYAIESKNGGLSVSDVTPTQSKHVRIGAQYVGAATVSGGIADWTTSFKGGNVYQGLSIDGDTKNAATVRLSGSFATEELPHAVDLTVSNGDGNSADGQIHIYAHGPLAFGPIPAFTVKRLAGPAVLGAIPYDDETVIYDYSGAVSYPIITIDHPEQLPEGIAFDGRNFVGSTAAAAGTYGPFKATIMDYTGETAESGTFSLSVTPRDEIAVKSVTPPVFSIRRQSTASSVPVVVQQPSGAAGLDVAWSVGGGMPDWLSFDSESGAFTAEADLPTSAIGTYGPFTVTATDSDGSSVTSSPFDINVVDMPLPATAVVPGTTGNVSGDASKGETSTFVQTPELRSLVLADTVVGGPSAVNFVAADPANPAGLVFDTTDGSFRGEPDSEFDGDVTVTFEDADGRVGATKVPLQVRAYPSVRMDAEAFELQRMADAGTIKASAVSGFWGTPVWSLDRGTLPAGLSVGGATGALEGSTTVTADTVFSDIVIKARDGATGLVARTAPFSIKILAKGDYSVAYGATDVFYLTDQTDTAPYGIASHSAVTPSVSGSARVPLAYSVASSDVELPDGLSVNPVSGVATFVGTPVLGRWNMKIAVKDADGEAARSQADLSIWSTLSGDIKQPATTPGKGEANGVGSGNKYVLRVGEPFLTDAIEPTNVVGDVTFSASPATLYPGLDFSGVSGAFSDESHFEAPGQYAVSVGATDRDGRTMPPLNFTFDVLPPLGLEAARTVFQSKQYAPASIDAQFERAKNALGKVSYRIEGDVPGTLTNRVYDDGGMLTGYAWKDAASRSHELSLDNLGDVAAYTVDGVVQTISTPDPRNYLAPDAITFDPAALTLKGTPSRTGTFALSLVATDDHMGRYVKQVQSRVTNNTAELAFSVVSEAAAPLQVVNSTRDGIGGLETVNLRTSQATLTTTVSNAAYGRPVTWTLVAGTLPHGIMPVKGSDTLSYAGYPEATGTYADLRWRATDAAGRSVESAAAILTVTNRLPMQLLASSNPKGMIVNGTDADLTVTARNTGYGLPVKASKWTVSGTLPPGVTYDLSDGSVHFKGQATVIGTYSDIIVTGADDIGGSASVSLTFKVIAPSDAIELAIANLTTKVGYPITIQASATNTYGGVRFYSNDIATKYSANLAISADTGAISGAFPTTQQANFDVFVTDETNRVTSKPVVVDVIPMLRITVPTLVTLTQGSTVEQAVDTFNDLGTVTFEKAGQWPEGVTLNPSTGAIGLTNAAVGTYAGLQIRATDTFSGTQTDVQLSNAFSLQVDPIDALPVIANPTGNKLPVGTVGTAFPAYAAAVTDNVSGKAWPGPLTFSLNHDIAADTGLTFDTATGTISGTPTNPIIYKDLVITATSERGDKASTQPLWFGVKPAGDITPELEQQTHFVLRMDTDFSIGPFKFQNTYGTLTYSGTPTATDPNTGILGGKAPLPASWYTGPNGKWTGNFVTVTDEFGRKGTIEYSVTDVYGLTVTPPVSLAFGQGEAARTSAAPAVVNVYGTASFTAQDLPSWLTLNANGSITGAAPSGTAVGSYPISVTVKDSYDGASKTVTYDIKVVDIKAYRVVLDTWVAHPSLATCVGLSEFRVFSGTQNITSLSGVTVSADDPAYPAKNLTDGIVTTSSMWFITTGAEKWIKFSRVPNFQPTSIEWVHRADGYTPCNPTSWRVQTTSDNQTWTTVVTGSGAGAPLATVRTTLP